MSDENKWIVELDDTGWIKHTCPNCGYTKRTDIHVSLGWKYCPKCGAPKINTKEFTNIYLITVFDKCEPTNDSWGYDIGCTRSVGWRPTFEMAEEAVKTNMCDIWEYCYDYACIEELDYSLYPWAENRWFYKFNEKTKQYEEIDEPVILKNHGPIGGIG